MPSLVSNNVTTLTAGRTKNKIRWVKQLDMKPGLLYPVVSNPLIEPGTGYTLDLAAMVRGFAMVNPAMGELEINFDCFFTPLRLVFDKAKQLFGQNDQSAWTASYDVVYPFEDWTMDGDPHFDCFGTIIGLPYASYANATTNTDVLPVSATVEKRAYCAIYNYYYRNQNVTDPVLYTLGSNGDSDSYRLDHSLFSCCKARDVISGLTPAVQKGPAITVPLVGGLMKVGTLTTTGQTTYPSASRPISPNVGNVGSTSGVYADTVGSKVGLTLESIRKSAALQQFYEKLVQGSRYPEYISEIYGVKTTAARDDDPEWLASFNHDLSIVSVTSTSNGTGATLGAQGAKSETGMSGNLLTFEAKEHGVLTIIAYIRLKNHVYANFMRPEWMIRDLWDLRNPMFVHTGDVAFPKVCAFVNPTTGITYANGLGTVQIDQSIEDNDRLRWVDSVTTLGYQQYGWQTKFRLNQAVNQLNPYVPGSLSTWTVADRFVSTPSLNNAFIEENPDQTIDRLFVDTQLGARFTVDLVFDGFMYEVGDPAIPGMTRI